MHLSHININVANFKNKIEEDYFTYKDIFSKIVVACLYLQVCNDIRLSSYIKIETPEYDNMFKNLSHIGNNLNLLLYNICLSEAHTRLLLDFNLYLDDFFKDNISESSMNVISLDIDRTDYATIKIKKFKLNKDSKFGHAN